MVYLYIFDKITQRNPQREIKKDPVTQFEKNSVRVFKMVSRISECWYNK